MNTLTITLRQHTPLIHFQHYQYNATLRASEVKPKLDKFILGKLGENNYERGKEKAKKNGWLIGKGEHPALNYKMKIIPVGEIAIWEINTPKKDKNTGQLKRLSKNNLVQMNTYPLFFANLDKNYEVPEECKQFSFVEQLTLELHFSDSVESLHNWINEQKDLFSRFFFFNNFGARNSKGFGSFYPDEKDERFAAFGKNNRNLFGSKYSFNVNASGDVQARSCLLFSKIELLYKALRGGINEMSKGGFKFKSLLQTYCEEILDRKWEKQGIINTLNHIDTSNTQYLDIKDMLGFSKEEKWEAKHDGQVKRCIAIKDNNNIWRKPTKEEEKELPERMKSPILFKPLYDKVSQRYTIYIRPMQKTVHSQEFAQQEKVCVSVSKGRQFLKDLFVDLPDNFAISDFLDYVFNRSELDFSTYVDEQFHDHSYYKELPNIYDDIVTNLTKSAK